jgi:hypothetical protein
MMKTTMLILGCFLVSSAAFGGLAQIQVTKCTVTAGKGIPADSITVSGVLLATEQDFQNAALVTVELNCATMISPLPYQFDVTEVTFKNGKLNGIGVKLTTKNYATASLGILKFNRLAKVSVNIPGTFSGSQTVNENAVLADTNASE